MGDRDLFPIPCSSIVPAGVFFAVGFFLGAGNVVARGLGNVAVRVQARLRAGAVWLAIAAAVVAVALLRLAATVVAVGLPALLLSAVLLLRLNRCLIGHDQAIIMLSVLKIIFGHHAVAGGIGV